MPLPTTVVFVHGWSVKNTNTYGQLPERLVREAAARGVDLQTRNVWLSRYVSFRDEVQVEDLSRAFQAAVERDLADVLKRKDRFACITHSTGGPVVRDWWNRYYLEPRQAPRCPMSHLVMLAPANFGSALAQLGKSRLSRVKAWIQDGLEPGTGVLDWLELGSPESWELNRKWITGPKTVIADSEVFPFVLSGQTIDRSVYDHLNSYTGEAGSDGVVRLAAANLNATWIRLDQEVVRLEGDDEPVAPKLVPGSARYSPETVFKVIPGRSHSGKDIGILRSVAKTDRPHPTVEAVLACLDVSSIAGYDALRERFAAENELVQEQERARVEDRFLLPDTVTLTDRYSMVVSSGARRPRPPDRRVRSQTHRDLAAEAARPTQRRFPAQGLLRRPPAEPASQRDGDLLPRRRRDERLPAGARPATPGQDLPRGSWSAHRPSVSCSSRTSTRVSSTSCQPSSRRRPTCSIGW